MISNKRRYFLIIISVVVGSLISFWLVKKRVGTLSPENYMQLALNFIFALAVVVGLAIFFGRKK